MYTSIAEYLNAKKIEKANESSSHSRMVKTEKNLAKREVKRLGSLLERLTYCHFILSKGLISESSSFKSINEAFKKEFNLDNYFKTDEQFNTYYVKSIKLMKRFINEDSDTATLYSSTVNIASVSDQDRKKAEAMLTQKNIACDYDEDEHTLSFDTDGLQDQDLAALSKLLRTEIKKSVEEGLLGNFIKKATGQLKHGL